MEKYYRKLNIPSGDLRISITDFCNMNCSYCHNEGQAMSNHVLAINDIVYIVEKSLDYGVHKIRLTGGEPLLHKDIIEICNILYSDIGIRNLGINTNCVNNKILFKIFEKGILSQIVVGIDYYDALISKDSTLGLSSKTILSHIYELKKLGANIQIAMVYNGDFENVCRMVSWCIEHKVLLKILEKTGGRKSGYDLMIKRLVKKFGLSLGITVDLNEYYAFDLEHNKILFFQSHCNRRECDICKNLHMRVTSMGYAKPCMLRDDTTFSLLDNFDEAMTRAIVNLGNPPGNIVR